MIRSFTRILFALTALLAAVSHAQVSYTGGVYSQNFNTLSGTTNNMPNEAWTDNTTLAGWYANKTTFSVTDGTLGGSAGTFNSTVTANNVGLFSFGSSSSAERALGSRATTSPAGNNPVLHGVKLVNDTGGTLSKFTVIYTGEQWFKSSTASAHTLNLEYQFGATAIGSGTWAAVSAGLFTAPISTGSTATILDGNAAANRTVKAAVVSGVSWAAGQSLWIRFSDANETGNEQGLAVDDFAFLADPEIGLFFNGSTGFVTMGAGSAPLGAGSFTIECRFLKTGAGVATSTGGDGVTAIPLLTKGRDEGEGNTTDCNYFLGIDANGKLVADFEQLNATNNGTAYAAGQNFSVTGSTTLQDGVWYHVAATYDTTSATWSLYVNGVAETLTTPLATFAGVIPRSDSTQHFGIGTALNSSGAAAGFFQGAIDEVRVWNYARPAADILPNIETKIFTGVAGLLGRYGFDAGSGTTAAGITATGAAPSGTLSGSTLPQWVNTKAFANSPNTPPTVAMTSPADGSTFDSYSPPTLEATASDADGSVSKVEFYDGPTKLGEDTTTPFTYAFPGNLASGTHSFTARAIDAVGASTTSTAINVTFNNPNNVAPAVSLISPVNNAAHTAGSAVTVTAAVSDTDGFVTKVQFYQGATLINEDTSAPFTYAWTSPSTTGNYTFTAVATDNDGATNTSAPVTITLTPPQYTSYTQNFDAMGGGTALPTNWSVFGYDAAEGDKTKWTNATGIPANEVAGGILNSTLIPATVFTATSATQGYNFALPATTDRALGTSPTTTKGMALQLSLTNTAGLALNSVLLGYDIRRFTAGSAENELPGYQIFYSLDSGTTWTNVAALNPTISGPTGVVVPNTIGVTTVPLTNFNLSGPWASNATLLLRWVDDNAEQSSPDQVIGLDNLTVKSGDLRRGPYLQIAAPTRMTIRWRTLTNVAGRVQFGTTLENLDQTVDEPAATTEHSVTLTGLTPNTTYFYSIGSATETLVADASLTFTTPPTAGTSVPTRIWALGDAGTSSDTAQPQHAGKQAAVRDAFYTWTGTRAPNLVLQLGDNAYNYGYDTEYQAAVFDMYTTMLRKTTFWSCLGNHEVYGSSPFAYFNIYTFPIAGEAGGVASGTENYYSFDYGNIHFISLDSMTAANRTTNGAMATWLQSDLANTTATWIICFFHHPPYSKGSHDSDNGDPQDPDPELVEMRENIVPILEAGGVDLVLSGHSHVYERSKLIDGHYGYSASFLPAMFKNSGDGHEFGATGPYIKPLSGPRDYFGAVYTVAGSAGKATAWTSGSNATVNPFPHPVMMTSLLKTGSVVLDIDGNRLDAKFLNSSGVVDDFYTLIKQGAADSDSDGISDEYEIAHGLNRFVAADALLDGDVDGTINRDEYVLGLNSQVPDKYIFTTSRNAMTGAVSVSFPTITARNYRVWYSDDLTDWTPASPVFAGNGSTQIWVDDGSQIPVATGNRRFYKIIVTVVP